MTSALASEDAFLYDAILTQTDPHRRFMVFSVGGAVHTLQCEHAGSFSGGAVGRLRLPTDRHPFVFQIYADQRLRRWPEIDDREADRWGWRIGERKFTVQWGILPGRNGAVIPRDTKRLELDIPSDFVARCEQSLCDPQSVIKAFISDLCSLSSQFERPREDGYSNRGPSAIELANHYFKQTFETSQAQSPPKKRRGRRPKSQQNGGMRTNPPELPRDDVKKRAADQLSRT